MPAEPPSRLHQLGLRALNVLRGVWSTTQFPERRKSREYAERVMLEETRRGVTLMAVVSLLIQLAAITLSSETRVP